MPRVMLLGNLPLAGSYRPAPGRRIAGVRGLGDLLEACNDPGMAIGTALASGAGAGFGGAAGDDEAEVAAWRAVGGAFSGFSSALQQQCQQARAAAAAGDPTAAAELQAQLDLARARNEGFAYAAQNQAPPPPPAKDYTPYYVVGGLAVLGVLGAAFILK